MSTATPVDAVLLEDDVFVQEAWRFFAEQHRLAIVVVTDAREILALASHLPPSTPIFIDVELAAGQRGESVAAAMIASGFTSVHLSTGHAPADVSPPLGLAGVIGKTPPDWLRTLVHKGSENS